MSAGIWIHKYSRFLRVSIYIYIRGARSAYVQDRRGMWCFNPSTDPGDYFFERRKGERGGWNRVRLCKTVTDIPRSYLSRIWRFDLIVDAIKPTYSDVSDVWRDEREVYPDPWAESYLRFDKETDSTGRERREREVGENSWITEEQFPRNFESSVRQLQHGSSWPSPKISFHSPVTLSNFCPTSFLRFIFSHILAFTSEISLLTVEINKKKKKREKWINPRILIILEKLVD